MLDSELQNLSAKQLVTKISSGELTAVEVTERFIDGIERTEPVYKAFSQRYFSEARSAAAGLDALAKSGYTKGPLHGVPVALKDLVHLSGRVTSAGSVALLNNTPNATATIVRQLERAGAIIIGKTQMVELALGGWGNNSMMGTPRNPWDLVTDRVPGGSSSGSGVAIAARQVPIAVGTDTGGSVRLPAAYCGITALKPTSNRISAQGVMPLSQTLDAVGPMARSVEDVELLYHVLSGRWAEDGKQDNTCSIPSPLPLKGTVLGVLPQSERVGVHPQVLAAYDDAVVSMSKAGAHIVEANLPVALDEYAEICNKILLTEAFRFYRTLVDCGSSKVSESVRSRLLSVKTMHAYEYLDALALRLKLIEDFRAGMQGIDALLTPTTETAAPALDAIPAAAPTRFTRFANLLDLSALALPNGLTHQGLPISLQIVSRSGDEQTALRIGKVFQAMTHWHTVLPPVVSG